MTVYAVQASVCFPTDVARDSVLAAGRARLDRTWGDVTLTAVTQDDGHDAITVEVRFAQTVDADALAGLLRRVSGSLHGSVRVHACEHDAVTPTPCTAQEVVW